jgi:predicted lipoprotein with Yx(FWY)xxD motif
MRRSNLQFVAAAALAAIALAACSSSAKTASPGTTPTSQAPVTTAAPPATAGGQTPTTVTSGGSGTVNVADSKFGKILVDSKGMTLYVDENDKPGAPACTGACLTAWPPLAPGAAPTFGTGLTAAMFTTVTLTDGTKQLAVKGFPLYAWMGDKKPGDVTGQDVNHFYSVMSNGVKYDPGAAAGS